MPVLDEGHDPGKLENDLVPRELGQTPVECGHGRGELCAGHGVEQIRVAFGEFAGDDREILPPAADRGRVEGSG